MSEPYEVIPEGEKHATVDWFARVVCGMLLAMIVMVASACPAHAAGTWCSDWADGFETGYCWRKADCQYIPPQICPAPKDGQTDGYVVGLRAGLEAGDRK